jgi:Flp pilus assembly CpaE family ATPase
LITSVGADCSTDVNGDAFTDLADLLSVLAAFGGYERFADVDRSGFVDLTDLLAVLSAFGNGRG